MFRTYSITCFFCLTLSLAVFPNSGKNCDGNEKAKTAQIQTATTESSKDKHPKKNTDYQYQVSGMTVSYETFKTEKDSTGFEWNLGDNTVVQSKSKFDHTFQNLGNYETCLTVNSSITKEKSTKKCKVITLGDPAICAADWVPVCGCDNQTYMNSCFAENYHGVYYWEEGPCSTIDYSLVSSFLYQSTDNPLKIQFINTSVGNFEKYIWNFSDGQTSNARNPQVIFSETGIYSICLTVSSEVTGMIETYCEDIEVMLTK